MDGKYEIGLDHIRALAIECHAYDVQFDRLFNQATICGASEAIVRTYDRLISISLLNLAIAVRVSLADEPEYKSAGHIDSAVLLLQGMVSPVKGISIKDVCDKLIHADRIYKPKEHGVRGAGTELTGTNHGEAWRVGLGVQIFCEYLLGWVEDIEQRRDIARPPG